MIEISSIRLFMHHVLSANSSLKSCIKSTRVNFSWNPCERFHLLYLEECVKFTLLQISWLWYSREHSGKCMHTKKPWYINSYCSGSEEENFKCPQCFFAIFLLSTLEKGIGAWYVYKHGFINSPFSIGAWVKDNAFFCTMHCRGN